MLRPLLAAILLATAAHAQTDVRAERVARLDSALAALHTDGLFSGTLAISDASGEIVYRYAAGTHAGEPVTTATPLYVASVSKMMTAAAALSLVADGRIGLDDPVARHLDAWPYPEVTVRHLLDQTAGLHFLTTITAHADTTRPVTSAMARALLAEHRPGLAFAPGSAFAYDNANYAALAWLLGAVTGQPHGEVLRERVFEPAGMTDAFVGPSGEVPWIAWAGGDGDAVHASVEHLLAFDDAFWTGRIVPDSLVRAALTPPTLADGGASRYVFGRFVQDEPWPLVGHWGEGDEVKTGLWRERAEGGLPGTTYAIEATDDGVHRTPVLGAVLSIWKGEPFEFPQPRPVADVPDAVLARHVGDYSSNFGLLHITLEGGQLHLEPEGAGGSEPLIAASETVFYFGGQDLTWEFVVEDGRTVGLQLQGQPETYGARVE
ncbi:serine hydrolase domain-containing protein [Rubrivirga marina]|uniref:Beta-lactamase-related domain-containing protein n=1 Tax=Rubrivirga marina TaxID=1196024 RepID=A0A271IW45_9BACT|nr:serine hydrolase domain-containing protein [Rubrivirga marina]PAP75340.1 hypothetical protein BSZ37_02205 [Rubrivirga marina]